MVRHRGALALTAVAAFIALSLARSPARSSGISHTGRRGTSTGRVTADFNGDGYADLAVAVLYASTPNASQAGGVDVIYGGPDGLQSTSPAPQFWTADSSGMPTPAQAGDQWDFVIDREARAPTWTPASAGVTTCYHDEFSGLLTAADGVMPALRMGAFTGSASPSRGGLAIRRRIYQVPAAKTAK